MSLLANASRNKLINITLNNMLMDSKRMLRLMIYWLPSETSLGIRNSFSTISSLVSTQKAMMTPKPPINAHLNQPKWLRPKGRNTDIKRMAISALWSLSLIMVVFILSAKIRFFSENRYNCSPFLAKNRCISSHFRSFRHIFAISCNILDVFCVKQTKQRNYKF